MSNFKKDVGEFFQKNNIRFKEDTPERLYQDLQKLKSKLKVKCEPGSDKYRTAKYNSKRQFTLF